MNLSINRVKSTLRWLKQANQLDYFPLRKHLRGYGAKEASGDFSAGLNVALLAFPQGMAYALIAGLPIQYGIYGSAVAAIVASFFAGSRFITLGPTNATSVTLASALAALGIVDESARAAMMPMLLVMIGFFLVVGAYLRVASVIQYVSRTVVTGYITAASLLIIVGQAKNALGIVFTEEEKENATTFFEKLIVTVKHLPELHVESTILSGCTAVIYFVLQKKLRTLPNVAITLIAVSLIAVVTTHIADPDYQFSAPSVAEVGESAVVAAESGNGIWSGEHIRWLQAIDASDWPVSFPSWDFDEIAKLANVALAIALLCVLEGTSIGKSLAARSGEKLDGNQEMFSIGAANVACGFFGGMPASGSLTRSQLSWASGGKTPVASLMNGVMVAAGAFALGPLIKFIPQSVLAVLVIFIGVGLFNRHAIHIVTKATRSDAAVFYTTCIAGLLIPLDTAIYMGAGLSIILFLRKAATPELAEYGFDEEGHLSQLSEKPEKQTAEISIVHVEGDLFFGAAEIFDEQMRRVCEQPNLKIVVLKMRNARHLDATSAMAIEELVGYMNDKDRTLILSECRPECMRTLTNSGILEVLNPENVFSDEASNPTLSTAKALRRAQKIIGDQQADIKIYVNPNKRKKVGEE
ncbi:MAG: SulP family inorganic anion transporter [Puniceicoccales bacterium]